MSQQNFELGRKVQFQYRGILEKGFDDIESDVCIQRDGE